MAKERLSDAQLRNQRAQALRALRRIQRTVDSQLEIMERKMDRSIENKEKITVRSILSIAESFKKFIETTNTLEKGLADAIQIFMG